MGIKFLRTLGIISIIIGAFFIFSSYPNITGFTVFGEVSKGFVGSILGIAFIIGGSLLLMAQRYKTRSQ